MLTIAIQNSNHSGEQAIEVINRLATAQELCVKKIAPKSRNLYYKNRRISIREYMERLSYREKIDILVLQLTKEGINNQIYDHIPVHVMVILEDEPDHASMQGGGGRRVNSIMKMTRSNYYIIPYDYKYNARNCITYGWSKCADVVATSLQMEVEGQAHLQCSIQGGITTLQGTLINGFEEFSLKCSLTSVEGMLAGMATMILYGIK